MAVAGTWKYLVLPAVLVPLTIVLRLFGAPDLFVFAAAGVTVIPLAHLMGVATELIIALVALTRAASLAGAGDQEGADGLVEVVKASITGSIIGNILLVLGLSLLVGGLRYKTQSFSVRPAELQVTLLVLAIVALVMPAR